MSIGKAQADLWERQWGRQGELEQYVLWLYAAYGSLWKRPSLRIMTPYARVREVIRP